MFYTCLKTFFRIIFGILFRPIVRGRENVPVNGGMIMAANHLSNWDPPMAGTYMPRPVAYMAKEELFRPAVAGAVIRSLYAFPVKRGAADRSAIKTALSILKQGLCLGVFPEGTRSRDGRLGKAESGVALLAAMGRVPVVPTAIIGTNRIFHNGGLLPRIKIIFGEPLYFEGKHNDKEALNAFAQKIMGRIAAMIDENEAGC